MEKNIKGVLVNVEHPDVKGKSAEELKAAKFFEHLPKSEQDEAYAELAMHAQQQGQELNIEDTSL